MPRNSGTGSEDLFSLLKRRPRTLTAPRVVSPPGLQEFAILTKNVVNAGWINVDDEQTACRSRWHADQGAQVTSPPAANLAFVDCGVLESVLGERLFVIAAGEDRNPLSGQRESAIACDRCC